MALRPALFLSGLCLLASCAKKEQAPPPPPTVVVAQPLKQRVTDYQDYVGRFVSIDAVDLRPRVSGYLQRLAFTDGQRVRKGQLLFVIDPRPYLAVLGQARAQTGRARATLNNAEVELRRARALFQAQAGSEQDVQTRLATQLQAKADLQAARENERAAALNVEFTRVTAPLSGRISDRKVAPGNLVTADQTVLTSIVNDDPIRFAFEVSETLYLQQQRSLGRARAVGDPVEVRLQDEPDYRNRGRLEFIDNALDVNSGVVRMRARIPNPSGLLTPGLFGHARMPGSAAHDALLLPDNAVSQDQNRQTVLVVGRDALVRLRPVTTGALVNGLRVVLSGLSPDDQVVINGTTKAKPGAKVNAKAGRVQFQKAAPEPDFVAPPANSAKIS